MDHDQASLLCAARLLSAALSAGDLVEATYAPRASAAWARRWADRQRSWLVVGEVGQVALLVPHPLPAGFDFLQLHRHLPLTDFVRVRRVQSIAEGCGGCISGAITGSGARAAPVCSAELERRDSGLFRGGIDAVSNQWMAAGAATSADGAKGAAARRRYEQRCPVRPAPIGDG